MKPDTAPLSAAMQVGVPLAPLLETALGRLARQKQYARSLARGGHRAETVAAWFGQAAACITALALPRVFVRPVAVGGDAGTPVIAGRVAVTDAGLAHDLAGADAVSAYLLTLGYGQARAFEWLEGDYSAHHVQSDLGGEVLFALGRHAHCMMRDANPGFRLRRVSIQSHDLCGQRKLWDPASVQALLGVFDEDDPGVRVTDTGCFEPLNAILGLTLLTARVSPRQTPPPPARHG